MSIGRKSFDVQVVHKLDSPASACYILSMDVPIRDSEGIIHYFDDYYIDCQGTCLKLNSIKVIVDAEEVEEIET